MAQGLDLEFVRDNYQRMSDDDLVRIATEDAAGLTPEAREIIKEEIEKRNLNRNIIKGVQAQNKELTGKEIDAYCKIVRNLDCPSCGTIHSKLNGTMTGEVISFILFTQYRKKIIVACPACLAKANNKALIMSATLGWWGIPWGVIRTVQSISQNLKSKKAIHLDSPNTYLTSFVLSHIGQLETYRNDRQKLQEAIFRN